MISEGGREFCGGRGGNCDSRWGFSDEKCGFSDFLGGCNLFVFSEE
jgi:hypothetical protein